MTDYVPYTPDEYAPDAPGTALHFQRWFENWIAGFEGAPGAPRLETAALGLSFFQAGGLGTYVFARAGATDIAFGETVSGGALRPASAAYSWSDQVTSGTNDGNSSLTLGATLSGTWKCMGNYDATSGMLGGATLFVRIA